MNHAPSLLCLTLASSLLACSGSPETTSSGGTSSGGAAGQSGAAGQGGTAGQGGSTSQGGSAGAGGAAGQGGSAGAGGADPCKAALYCDDFEGYDAGGPPGGAWSVNTLKGSIAVDTTHARSGARAVKIAADAADGYRSAMMGLAGMAGLPAAGNVIYGRMMFWLDSAPEGTVHWTFIDGYGLIPGQSYHALYRYGGQHPITDGNGAFVGSQLMANYDTPDSYSGMGPGSDCWLHSDKKVVPVGGWACAEWKFDGPASKMQFWLDGVELPDLAMNGAGQGCVNQPPDYPWTAPTFERVDLGWESYQPDGARTIWIDDVVISTQKVGCP